MNGFVALYDDTDAALVRWLTLHLACMEMAGWDATQAREAARTAARQMADAAVDAASAEVSGMAA